MQRKLGRSGIWVSALGLGCAGVGGPFLNQNGGVNGYGSVSDKTSIKAIRVALNMGVNYFDTADVYGCGRSERVLGEALGSQRDDVIIATKFGNTWDESSSDSLIPCRATGTDTTREAIYNSCFESMKRLKTNYIDVFQLHLGNYPIHKARAVMNILDELVDESLIRCYGWSTNDSKRAAAFSSRNNYAIVQFRHNLISRNDQMLTDVINIYDVAGVIKGPLGYGLLTGKYSATSIPPKDHVWTGSDFSTGALADILSVLKKAREILTSDGRTLSQAAIGWIWSQNNQLIPIPGFKTVQQVEENVQALEYGSLNQNQLDELENVIAESCDPWS